MKWYAQRGIWEFGPFRGTTPRNGEIWTFDIVVGKYELWMGTGKHAYITFFNGPDEKWSLNRNPKNCTCYGCSWRNPSPKMAAAMAEAMTTSRHKHVGQHSYDTCDSPDMCDGMLPPRPSFSEEMHQPLDPEIREALAEKYAPKGCQPSDCCGDEDAHL